MESLREVKQSESQAQLSEVTRCIWVNTKGNKIGQLCGRTAINSKYCNTHKNCNPELQATQDPEEDTCSEVNDKFQKLIIGENTTMEFVIRRKNVRIIIE
jgi:hypothetical protein